MTMPNDVRASIEKHLQAVREHLSDKEEAIRNEILEGLRDHINETLTRDGGPITLARIEAILAGMDEPSSYAEEPALAGASAAKRERVTVGNKWLYVAMAFLAINSIGVWKLIQIERKTGAGNGPNGNLSVGGAVAVPHVPSDNKADVRYPATDLPAAPTGDPEGTAPVAADHSFRSVAFLENRNPVLQQSDQELTWLFSADVVAQPDVGKPQAGVPMKINPEVAGEFIWKSPAQLVFKPRNAWSLNRSYTAELSPDFKASSGDKYEGNRFWRFSTAVLDLEKFAQSPQRGAFLFNLTFSMAAKPESLSEKLKLFYLNANGEKLPLSFKILADPAPASVAIETPIVPAISFVCEIESNLLPLKWSDGTREKIERKLPNSQLLALSAASFDRLPGAQPSVTLLFSAVPSDGDLSRFIEISPTTAVAISKTPGRLEKLRLTGDFVAGIAYEIKVKSGLTSREGGVLPFDTTRSLVLSQAADATAGNAQAEPERPQEPFEAVAFMANRQTAIETGKQELRWKFACPVATQEAVGYSLKEAPITLSPNKEGSFFWATPDELVFRPNMEWDLNHFYEARLVNELVNLAGARYSGARFWTFTTPAMTIREAVQMGGGRGFRFSVHFSILPDAESLKNRLKVFCYTAAGTKNYLPFELENDYYNSANKQVGIPAAPTSMIYFELEPGFRPAKWTQGIKEKVEVAAVISTVLRVNSVTQSGGEEKTPSIQVHFSESVDVKSAAAFIDINPPVKFTVQRDSSREILRLFGPFVPHRDYQVKVKAGLVSEKGFLLVNESTSTVSITRAAASLGFAGAGGYLSPAGTLLVPITFQNLSQCKVAVAPVMASNLVYFARRNSNDASYNLPDEPTDGIPGRGDDGDGYEDGYYRRNQGALGDVTGNVTYREVKLTGAENTATTDYLHLRDFTKTKGAYLVQIRGEDAKNENSYRRRLGDSRLVVVTDLGISAKCSKTQVLAWVCSLKDAKPAGGVEVTAYSANNQVIAKAATNADGVVAIPCNAADKNTTPFLVTAQLADDLSYLRLDQRELQGDHSESTRDYQSAGCEAFLFTDRGIFRPGETLHARTIIRQADFTAPAAFPVVFQIIKPDGRMFKEIAAMPNAFGAAEVETIMPDYLPTGSYTIRLRVPQAKVDMGTKTFLLEDFVPPQIRVTVTTDPERVRADTPLKAAIFAEHLFGAPAAGLKANVKCIYTPVAFAPKPWSDYRFGIQTAPYWGRDEANPFAMKPQDIDNLVLDNAGKVTAEIATAIPAKAPGPIQALVQASVFEQSGRAITATKSAVIDPYPFYIGVKRPAVAWLKSGESHRISVITVRPNGETCKPEKPLTVRLSHLDWNYSYKRTPGGSYAYEGHKVVTLLKEEVLDLSSGAAKYSFIPTGYGQHELSIADPDSGSTTSFSFYASDYEQSWTTTQRDQPDSLTLKLDKPEYPIGETARLTIQAPFSGTALLTVESDKVLQSRVIFLEKNTAEVDVEIKEAYAPNVHCTVSVIRPAVAESVWKGHRAFGSIPLKVAPRNHRINVAVETPPTILPQSKLRTRVLLKDDAGQPVNGEVTLVAVDEAICMLTSFKTPSPLAWLYELRRLGVASHDVYAELMEVFDESVLTKKSNPGGDGGGGEDAAASERLTKRLNPIKANRFKPVSLWVSKVVVTNGVAEVEMDVPEFTGELRVMAIACNARQLGSAQGVVKVKRPLIVQPSLPRFLAPGDECLMDVTVFNEMGKDITAKLQITCGGPLSTKLSERNIDLKTGASASVSIPMVAGNLPGKALCTVSCEAESVRFSDTIEIAVRPPVSAEVIADSGSLAPGKSVEIRVPANWLPESVLRHVQVSKEPSLELGHGLQYLMRYPYGCIEQTTSGAFPLLYLPDLANRTFDKSMGKERVRDYVMSGVWRILSMQQTNGGFAYWPGFNEPCPWGTSYATHFLIEAKKAGYEVPQGCLERALKALREGLESNPRENNRDVRDYDSRAYACYVLAIAGEPEHAWQTRMLEMKDKLSYYARLMNASALLVQGDPKRAVVLLKELGLPGAGARDQGGCFNSSNRNAALLLSAWLDIDPNHADVMKLVQLLSKAKINGYWGTTQDNAMVLMALGKYAQRIKRESLEFKGMITLPNGTTEEFDQTKDRQWEVARSEAGNITLTNRGPGNLFYSFQAEGVPIDLPEYYQKLTAKNQGMNVKREWLDDEGNPIDITKIKQNDLVVARITLNPNGHSYENIAIEDLLPAGLEIENPNLDTAQSLPWLKDKFDWCARRDIRDDRILLFTRPVSGPSVFCYLARAVTPGKFMVPPVSAECMYEPEVRSVSSQAEMMITK
ncbi:MAG: MG2 domain-containing protein [Verrucomicrobia bacterium]|nr:MG2 domain-containing protein [Verrucomicrobiota bacterium]